MIPPNFDFSLYFNMIANYFTAHFPSVIGILIGITIPLSVLLLIGIVVAVEGIKSIARKEDEIYNAKVIPAYAEVPVDADLGRRWSKITIHMASGNQNDWKQAIIEADVMLDDLVTKQGYQGTTLGEKLKRVTRGDFKTLDQAWEAHKVRNMIAHDGSGFEMNQVEAKRVIALYRQVFEEFYHISG